VGHAEIDAAAKRDDRAFAIALVDVPGALPDYGYFPAGRAELLKFHHFLKQE